MLDSARRGDTIVVYRLDRLSRSVSDLVSTMTHLSERGIEFRSLSEQIDTTTPGGRLIFHLFAAVAQFETDLIRERTRVGLAAARERGKITGRPSKISAEQRKVLLDLYRADSHTVSELAELFNVSRATIYRTLGDATKIPKR